MTSQEFEAALYTTAAGILEDSYGPGGRQVGDVAARLVQTLTPLISGRAVSERSFGDRCGCEPF